MGDSRTTEGRHGATEASGKEVDGWYATVDLLSGTACAFGRSPEEAVNALVDIVTKSAEMNQTDPSVLLDARESLTIAPFAMGSGYALAGSDFHWFDGLIDGEDARFDDAFRPLASARRSPR